LVADIECVDDGVVGACGGHAEGGAGSSGDGAEGDGVRVDAGGSTPQNFVAGEVGLGAGVPDEGTILNGGERRGCDQPESERQKRADHCTPPGVAVKPVTPPGGPGGLSMLTEPFETAMTMWSR